MNMVSFVEDKKVLTRGVSITVIALCIMALIGWLLYIYGVHATDKRVTEIEQQRIERTLSVDKSLKELKIIMDTKHKEK